MITCTESYEQLARVMGPSAPKCDSNPFVTFTNPFALANWTLPVIELLLVVGAAACLVHALRWRKTHGDSTNLVIWVASIVALLLIEPLAYFPQWFGVEKQMGLTFIHNQFTVQFLYGRLPLYIVAMYPVYTYVAYILVQRTGIFKRYNVLVSATAVAFVFHCLYEIIDTVGVQFRWWVWNENLSTSLPKLGVVPYLNIQTFSLSLPFAMTAIALLLAKKSAGRGNWIVVRNVILVSLGLWPVLQLFSLPATIADLLGARIETARFVTLWVMVAGAALITAIAFIGAYRARRADPDLIPDGVQHDYFALTCVIVYMVAAAVFWIAALPDYLKATNGVTPSGAPTGSLTYAVITAVLSVALTAGAYLATTGRQPATPAPVDSPARV